MRMRNGFFARRFGEAAAGAALVLVLVGCSGSDGPPLVSVTGTVTRGGQFLSGANVMFIPSQGAPSGGQTDERGHFELTFTDGRPGAVTGRHQVNITVPSPEVPPPLGGSATPPSPPPPPLEFQTEQEIAEGSNELTIEVGS